MIYLTNYQLNKKIKKKRELIKLDFPEFLNKLTLLVNAGMTVKIALEKAAMDSRCYLNRPLYKELTIVMYDLKLGMNEREAYELFAKRCRVPEVTKFVCAIIQNLRKGNGELTHVLRIMANDCWESRKNVCKTLGEEASTKMIFPMMIMFIALLLIVATPAVLAIVKF